jgi:hypothetical protein
VLAAMFITVWITVVDAGKGILTTAHLWAPQGWKQFLRALRRGKPE